MNTVLWVVQGIMAIAFLLSGGMKVFQPIESLGKMMKWVPEVPSSQVRLIGVAEILGAIGLIIPEVTGILPWLTPLAAVGLAVIMVGAALLHASRREYSQVPPSLVLLLVAVIVAYGRLALVQA